MDSVKTFLAGSFLNPIVLSWLLGLAYLIAPPVFLITAWAAGGLPMALLRIFQTNETDPALRYRPGSAIFASVLRLAIGFAFISWLTTCLGIAGLFDRFIVLPAVLCAVVSGWYCSRRFLPELKPTLFRDRLEIIHMFKASSRTEKLFCAAIIVGVALIFLNALIGALVPDMNRDPMTYHLAVPQQWLFSGRFDVYPNVMQSAFPLAAESLFALIFLVGGGPVLCSLLSVTFAAVLIIGMASGSLICLSSEPRKSAVGWGVMSIWGIFFPLLALYGLIAPVQPKNDIITMLWAFCGALAICAPLLADAKPPTRADWLLGGLLLGTAFSAKPPALCTTFFVLAFAVPTALLYEKQSTWKFPVRSVISLGLCLLAMTAASLPWMLRGYHALGTPLYPVGTKFFTLAPEFQPLNHSQTSIQGIPGLDWTEWLRKLQEFPRRLLYAAQSGERLVFVYMVCSVLGFIMAKGRWRFYALMLIGQTIFLIGITGSIEIYRLFAPSYCLLVPMLAWLVANLVPRMSNSLRYGIGILLCAAAFIGAYGLRQAEIARYATVRWKFRPVLSHKDVDNYARHAQFGATYLDFESMRDLIKKDERVLLLRCHYPFYLHRDTLWNDENIRGGGLEDRWSHMNASTAVRFLHDEKIDVILYTDPSTENHDPVSPMDDLLQSGVVKPAPLPATLTVRGWTMYRLNQH